LRAIGDKHGIGSSLLNLGKLARDAIDLPAARALHAESLAILRDIDDKRFIGQALISLGDVIAAERPDRTAGHLLAAGESLLQSLGLALDRSSRARLESAVA